MVCKEHGTEFIEVNTNHLECYAIPVSELYKKRWDIELARMESAFRYAVSVFATKYKFSRTTGPAISIMRCCLWLVFSIA